MRRVPDEQLLQVPEGWIKGRPLRVFKLCGDPAHPMYGVHCLLMLRDFLPDRMNITHIDAIAYLTLNKEDLDRFTDWWPQLPPLPESLCLRCGWEGLSAHCHRFQAPTAHERFCPECSFPVENIGG